MKALRKAQKAVTGPDGPGVFPDYGKVGVALVLLSWIMNWSLPGLRTHLLFFPQWLGYCLVVDGLVRMRTGHSHLPRNPGNYVLLFFLSAPVWWVFEGLNKITQNWIYLGRDAFTDLEYALFATLSFSTVIPAVFSTAELLASMKWVRRLGTMRGFRLDRPRLWALHLGGWIMPLLMVIAPQLFFPFLWLAPFFIIDSLNALRGRRSILADLSRGRVRALVVYGLGALVCGFFWELWNIYAFPKWIYDIPYLEVLPVFEMPLAGYGGYIPFCWSLLAIVRFFGLDGNR